MDIPQMLLVVIVAWLFLRFLRYAICPLLKHLRSFYLVRHVPYASGPTDWLSGHILQFAEPGKDVARWTRLATNHPRILRFRLFYITEIVLLHPETASLVLKTSEPKSETAYGWLRPWLGEGLLVSEGKRWARDRRLLTRGFHFDILRGYLPAYKEAAAIMLDQWAEVRRQSVVVGDGGSVGATVNVTKSAKLLTLDIILRCIMGFSSRCQLPPEECGKDEGMAEYARCVTEITGCLIQRTVTPAEFFDLFFHLSSNGQKFRRLKKFCHATSQRVIRERRHAIVQIKEGKGSCEGSSHALQKRKRYLDFLDILLSVKDEDGKGMSDKEIQEQVDTFLFEGHDTTASAMQWTIYYLAKNPHLQERCRQEVENTLDDSKDISYEQLGKLHYLTQFIKESMRMSSNVPYISRQLTQPLTVDEYVLPKGTIVGIPIIGIHYNPTVWEEPLKFNPERFSLEEVAKRHPFAFLPFSAGPRNCIGQSLAMEELKTVVSLILRRFRLTYDSSAADAVLNADLVARTIDDIKVFAHEI